MLAYEVPIAVPIAVPLICKKCSPLNVVTLTFGRHHWLSSQNGIHEPLSFGDHSCFDGRYVIIH
jgi:hypothetical protein